LVAYFNQLRDAGASPEEAVGCAGRLDRMRTVLMTGLLAALGLLPMAISTGIGSETQKPLAVVVDRGPGHRHVAHPGGAATLYLVFQRLNAPRWPRTRQAVMTGTRCFCYNPRPFIVRNGPACRPYASRENEPFEVALRPLQADR